MWPARIHDEYERVLALARKRHAEAQVILFQDIWKIVVRGMRIALPCCRRGLVLSKDNERAFAFYMSNLKLKMLKSFNWGGIRPVVATVKEFCHWMRTYALDPSSGALDKSGIRGVAYRQIVGNRRVAAQLAHISRALPCPSREIVKQSLKDHRRILTSQPPIVPRGDLLVIHKVLRERFLSMLQHKRVKLGIAHIPSLGSASFEHRVSEGGSMNVFIESEEELARKRERGVYIPDQFDRALTSIALDAAVNRWELAARWPPRGKDLPKARVNVVEDRGAKARVVTAMQEAWLVRGHAIADVFRPFLNAEPTFAMTEDDEERIISSMHVEPDELVLSTDLKAATDYGLFITARVVWHAMLSACVQHKEIDAVRAELLLDEICRHLGPHQLVYGRGNKPISKRGWLMGHPLTWMTLSWAHFAAAVSTVGSRPDGNTVFALKGDDGLIVGKRIELDRYLRRLSAIGFEVNHSKSYTSAKGGVFCETSYRVGRDGRFDRLPTAPVKALLYPSVEALDNLSEKMEKWLSKTQYKVYAKEFNRAYYTSPLAEHARKVGIVAHAPQILGGLGVPHPGGLPGALSKRRVVRALSCIVAGQRPATSFWSSRQDWSSWTIVRRAAAFSADTKSLGAFVPMTMSYMGKLCNATAACYAWVRRKSLPARRPSLAQVAHRFRWWFRKSRSSTPRHLINPKNWTYSRLRYYTQISVLSGMYRYHGASGSKRITKGLELNTLAPRGRWVPADLPGFPLPSF